jgi:hypothetical protein
MLDMADLKYLIDSSLAMYARELLNDSDEIFKDYKEGDSIQDLLEENETLATLTGDLEETIEAMGNLENWELYTEQTEELYNISQDINFDRIEGKKDFENTLNELIEIVRKIII